MKRDDFFRVDWLHWEMCVNPTCRCRTGPVWVTDSIGGSLEHHRPGPDGTPHTNGPPVEVAP